jgi:hypothetical protein
MTVKMDNGQMGQNIGKVKKKAMRLRTLVKSDRDDADNPEAETNIRREEMSAFEVRFQQILFQTQRKEK